MNSKFYEKCLHELWQLLPREEVNTVFAQDECEYECDFLGFADVYRPLADSIPKGKIVIDFGCYLAAQAYFFKDHKQYIGVDVDKMRRFTPDNTVHYVCRIQEFIGKHLPELLKTHSIDEFYAICSYVPDRAAVLLVKKTFPNNYCYYPGEIY